MSTLRHGHRSQAVRELQHLLNAQGAKLTADGLYGIATEAAVRAFQLRQALVGDGIAGPKTLAALQGADTGQWLGHADLVHAAGRLGVPLGAVYALNQVESNGRGFLDTGKPVILFERHVMYKRLQHPRDGQANPQHLKQRADALARQYPTLVNPRPGGYVGGSGEHPRLAQACQLDEVAALESASWGAFQVMGYHWQRLRYASVQAFVDAMASSEAGQLDAFVRFIEAAPALHKALKALQWATVARLYNGPDYKRNLYDVKLARAFAQHQHLAAQAA